MCAWAVDDVLRSPHGAIVCTQTWLWSCGDVHDMDVHMDFSLGSTYAKERLGFQFPMTMFACPSMHRLLRQVAAPREGDFG